jgi:Arc/MetJ-type ribon-helix-helix transcriptional regulator
MYQNYSEVHRYVLRLLLSYRGSGLQLNLLLPAEQQMQMQRASAHHVLVLY